MHRKCEQDLSEKCFFFFTDDRHFRLVETLPHIRVAKNKFSIETGKKCKIWNLCILSEMKLIAVSFEWIFFIEFVQFFALGKWVAPRRSLGYPGFVVFAEMNSFVRLVYVYCLQALTFSTYFVWWWWRRVDFQLFFLLIFVLPWKFDRLTRITFKTNST